MTEEAYEKARKLREAIMYVDSSIHEHKRKKVVAANSVSHYCGVDDKIIKEVESVFEGKYHTPNERILEELNAILERLQRQFDEL